MVKTTKPQPVKNRRSIKPAGKHKGIKPYQKPKPNETFQRSMVAHHQVPGENGQAQQHGPVRFMSSHVKSRDAQGPVHRVLSLHGGH